MKPSNLELAAAVYWGEIVDPDDCNLVAQDNPEVNMQFKETIGMLSEEATLVMNTILTLPDEIYHKTGNIIMYEVLSYMERRYKWPKKKVMKYCAEISVALGGKE